MVSDSLDPYNISPESQFKFRNNECVEVRIDGVAATTIKPSFKSSLKVDIRFNQVTHGDGTSRNDVRSGMFCDMEGVTDNGGSSSFLVVNGNIRSSTFKQTRVDPISIFDREHAVRKPFDGNLQGDYICNNCNRDVTNIRINCKVCFDFNLCVDCFSTGIAIGSHRKNHSCRLIEVITGKIVKPLSSKLKPSIKLMKKKKSPYSLMYASKDFLKKIEINFSVQEDAKDDKQERKCDDVYKSEKYKSDKLDGLKTNSGAQLLCPTHVYTPNLYTLTEDTSSVSENIQHVIEEAVKTLKENDVMPWMLLVPCQFSEFWSLKSDLKSFDKVTKLMLDQAVLKQLSHDWVSLKSVNYTFLLAFQVVSLFTYASQYVIYSSSPTMVRSLYENKVLVFDPGGILLEGI